MNVKSVIVGTVAGLLTGFILMLVFQFLTPFIEVFFLETTEPLTPDEYYSLLSSNHYLGAYYVISWTITVFGAALCSALISKNRWSSLISGGIYLLLFLYNPAMIEANIFVYASFIIVGTIGCLLPSRILGKMN